LELRNNTNIINGIRKVAEGCSNLLSLNLQGCFNVTDANIICLAESCPNLHTLNLQKCFKISDTSITKLAKECHYSHSLSLLGCGGITDASIDRVADCCPHLKILDCSTNIADVSIIGLADSCSNLQTLRFCSVRSISQSNVIIAGLINRCLNLCELDLFNCEYINTTFIHHFREVRPNLIIRT
jgi:F-box/leucine-rich repeat protein 2/20